MKDLPESHPPLSFKKKKSSSFNIHLLKQGLDFKIFKSNEENLASNQISLFHSNHRNSLPLNESNSKMISNKRRILLTRLKLQDRVTHMDSLKDLVNYEEKQLTIKHNDFRETQSLVGNNFEKTKQILEDKTEQIKNLDQRKQLISRERDAKQTEAYYYELENRKKIIRVERLLECKEFLNIIFDNFSKEKFNEDRAISFVRSIRYLKHFFITSEKDRIIAPKNTNNVKNDSSVISTDPKIDKALAEDKKLKNSLMKITSDWINLVEKKNNLSQVNLMKEMNKLQHKNDYMTLFESLLIRLDNSNTQLIQNFNIDKISEASIQIDVNKKHIESLEAELRNHKKEESELKRMIFNRLETIKTMNLENNDNFDIFDNDMKSLLNENSSYRKKHKPTISLDLRELKDKIICVSTNICGSQIDRSENNLIGHLANIEQKVLSNISSKKSMNKEQLVHFDRIMKKFSRVTKTEEMAALVETNRYKMSSRRNKTIDKIVIQTKKRKSMTRIVFGDATEKKPIREKSEKIEVEKYFVE